MHLTSMYGTQPSNGQISICMTIDEEINLYDYWRLLVTAQAATEDVPGLPAAGHTKPHATLALTLPRP